MQSTLTRSFDTILAFGDSFSSQCGRNFIPCDGRSEHVDPSAPRSCYIQARHTWLPDYRSGDDIHRSRIQNGCSANEGWNYLNYLTGCTKDGVDPLLCPVRLVDMAVGGAQVFTYESRHKGSPISPEQALAKTIEDQVADWDSTISPLVDISFNSTLVSMFVGINEVVFLGRQHAVLPDQKALHDMEDAITERIDALMALLDTLRQRQFRHFLILNIPLVFEWVESSEMITTTWNSLLRQRLDEWGKKFPVEIDIVDVRSLHQDMLSAPKKYGFDDVVNECSAASVGNIPEDCSESSRYLKMDFVHWTPRAHLHIAATILRQLGPVFVRKQKQNTWTSRSDIIWAPVLAPFLLFGLGLLSWRLRRPILARFSFFTKHSKAYSSLPLSEYAVGPQ